MLFFYIPIIIVLLFVLLTCSIIIFNNFLLFTFLYADYNLRSLYKPQEYPPASTWLYIKNFWTEVYYLFGKYYLLPAKWFNLTIKAAQKPNSAILLIHGYCRNQTDWLWMRRQLKATGCHIYTVNLKHDFASLQVIAGDHLVTKIKQIRAQTNCQNLILIGHSMGGLVASYYSEFLDADKLVKAVISIASPLSGTKVSLFGKGENAQQMCPGSEFIADLHTRLHVTQKKYYQVASKFDNLIYPWQSALIENTPTANQFTLPFAAHLSMLHNKEVALQLNKWLQDLT